MDPTTKVYTLYEKETLRILQFFQPNVPPVTPEQYFEERLRCDPECIGRPADQFDVIVDERSAFESAMKEAENYIISVDPGKKRLVYNLFKLVIKNKTYNTQSIKRMFSFEEIKKMYYEDYINFNMKNFIRSKNLVVKFNYLSDLKLRSHMFNKNWKYFHYDPFLVDSHSDKTVLGRDILQNGTYYPLVVGPLIEDKPNEKYVFEGNHRAASLKLLQMEGLVPEDYKICCIEYKQNYEMTQHRMRYQSLQTPFQIRGIIELVYGNVILVDDLKYQAALKSLQEDGGRMVDDYTIEWTGCTYDDILFACQTYPHWLRDLLYPYKSSILPSPVFNNENAFNEWINE
jgi:hypothetical protein